MYYSAVIIDDDADLCFLLKQLLKDLLPVIKCAHSYEAANELLKKIKPDVIFLDNNLPDALGIEHIQELRKSFSNSLLIMITASDKYRIKALESGVNVFIEKPLNRPELYKALNGNY